MFDREKILKCAAKQEDRLLLSKLVDKAVRASKTKSCTHSDFLDPSQQHILEKAMNFQNEITYELYGGYEGAERAVAFFYPIEPFFTEAENPVTVLIGKVKATEVLTHRDYLGTLMGLGIKREKIGDILVNDQGCSILVHKEVCDYIYYNLTRVGRHKISLEYGDLDSLETTDSETKVIKVTVASMRLDCIVSAGYGISRSRVSELIKAEKVSVNWEKKTDISSIVKSGDTISVRGRGRIIVESEGSKTKKGRISVVLNRLV